MEMKLGLVADQNKQILLKRFIKGNPTEDDMILNHASTCSCINIINNHINVQLTKEEAEGSKLLINGSNKVEVVVVVVVKNLYLSCDPYMRRRMMDYHSSYLPPFQPGSVIEGYGVSKVVHSNHPDFSAGDIVCGMTRWEEYSLIHDTNNLRKITPTTTSDRHIPLSYYVGLLGMPGFTAYAGFYEVCSPKAGDRMFVSAASGAVGQLVGQLAKLHGCYVVGTAGSVHKVDLLKNKLGFDEAFNYKLEETNLDAALKRCFPDGIDIYFDNVGGSMLDAVLLNMRLHGKIVICGMIGAHAVEDDERGVCNLQMLLLKRLTMKGFIQSDYLDLFPKFEAHVADLYRQGKIVYIEDMRQGLESAPAALAGLFSGMNVGKQVVCVAQQ